MSRSVHTFRLSFNLLMGLLVVFLGCSEENKNRAVEVSDSAEKTTTPSDPVELSEAFKTYWYTGLAELTSYRLEQARYGEIREGHAVLIYVTEDFNPVKQVKADYSKPENISVLKLNATKNFNTGIYPYSIMQSTFYPVSNNQHALKVSSSIQEWCGQVYTQINNRDDYEVMSHSYFEPEADQEFSLDKSILENEIWTQLRIDPQSLPQGEIELIPSLEFLRLKHLPVKAYKAQATLNEGQYEINYDDISRSLTIIFNDQFPYNILEWEESFYSSEGPDAKRMTTRAVKLSEMKAPYWQQNKNSDVILRDSLMLR
ncbi:MAG: septum formation inhibitor Maf [Flavobacteriaceae bacterium]|nr:septum formation inhibitor Maf [Flavobacteriaceae bacterium]